MRGKSYIPSLRDEEKYIKIIIEAKKCKFQIGSFGISYNSWAEGCGGGRAKDPTYWNQKKELPNLNQKEPTSSIHNGLGVPCCHNNNTMLSH